MSVRLESVAVAETVAEVEDDEEPAIGDAEVETEADKV